MLRKSCGVLDCSTHRHWGATVLGDFHSLCLDLQKAPNSRLGCLLCTSAARPEWHAALMAEQMGRCADAHLLAQLACGHENDCQEAAGCTGLVLAAEICQDSVQDWQEVGQGLATARPSSVHSRESVLRVFAPVAIGADYRGTAF